MQSQIHVPTLSKANKIIIGTYVGMFLLSTILKMTASINLAAILGLSAKGLMSGMIFQLITFPFIDVGLMAVVFNGLLIWFIGSELEQKWGTKFYLTFLAIATYTSGLFVLLLGLVGGGVLASMPFYGLAGTNLACLVAYGIIYSERTMLFMFIFPMKAKYFCMLLAAIEVFMALSSNSSHAAWGHVFAMAIGYGFLKFRSLKARGVSFQSYKNQKHKEKMKGRLTLIKGDEEQPKANDKHDPKNPKFWQ